MDNNDLNSFNNNQFLGGLSGLGLSGYGATSPSPSQFILQPANQLWFNHKDIILDGWCFSYCRFDNCRIFVNSQNFELINCLIDEQSLIVYQNNVLNVIKLFNSRYSHPFVPPKFNPIKNSDGTISIVREL
ncbi:TPA: hypothetical protein ACP7UU_003722 [Escherichia coli]